nr:MAG TPA: minor tail protein [Caudoviricetes sp.]
MANYDATIRVGTKMDASGLDAAQKGFDNVKNSAENAAKAIENVGKSTDNVRKKVEAEEGTYDNLTSAVEQYASELKYLESKGFGAGEKKYDDIYIGWIDAKHALDEYNKSLYAQSETGKAEAQAKAAAAAEKEAAKAAAQKAREEAKAAAEAEKEAARAAAQKAREEERIAAEAEKNLQIENAKLQKQIEEEAEAKRLASIKENSTVSDQRIVDLLEEEVALKKRLKELEAAGVTAGYQEHDAITGRLSDIKEEVNAYSGGFKKASDSGKKFFDTVAKGSKKSSGLLGTIGSRLKGIALSLLIFNWISKAFNAMVSSMKEGFKNLAQYSSDYNAAMSALKSQSAQLKNGLAAAFEPIVTTIIPYITQLVAWLNTATDTFARFLAALQGKQTYTKAKKQVIDYAKSLKTAQNAAQGALAAFDSINVLSKKDNGGAGGETTGSGAFEEAEVGSGMQGVIDKLTPFRDLLNQWMQETDFSPLINSFNNLAAACAPFSGYVYDGLLWFMQNILLPLASWTIQDAAPAFLNMLANGMEFLGKTIETVRPSFDYIWSNVLKPIAEFTGETFIWALGTIGQTFSDLSDLMTEKGDKINEILTAVGKGMELLWNVIYKPILQLMRGGISTLLRYIVRIVGDMIDVFSGIVEFVSGVFTGDWKKAWNGLVDIFKGAVNWIIDIFEGVVNTIIDGINSISIDFPDWLPVPGLAGKHFGPNLARLEIPRLATGGITSGPTTALIGEAGREAVLPLESNTEWMDTFADKLSDRPVNIRFTGNLAELARLLKPVLDAENSRIGRNFHVSTT